MPGSRRSIHNVRFPKKTRQLQVQVTVPASAGPSIRLRQQSTTDQRVNHVTTQLPKGKPGSRRRERPAKTQHSVSRNSKKRPFWPKISRAGPLVRGLPPGGLPNLAGMGPTASAARPHWNETVTLGRIFPRLFGAPGTAKTFVALDMGMRIAAGLPFHGRRGRATRQRLTSPFEISQALFARWHQPGTHGQYGISGILRE